jgi:hypothetical protein
MNCTEADYCSVKIGKEKEMTTIQTLQPQERTEEEFVATLKTKSTQELGQFLAGPWTASILSPEAIEGLYQVLQDRTEEDAVEMGQD